MERFLTEALNEDPVPTLQDLGRQLGYLEGMENPNSRSESRQTSNRKRMRLTEVSVSRISNRARARDPV